MKILLTGSNGYIGSQLLLLLLEEGHSVVALVRNSTTLHINHPNLKVIIADLLNPETLKAIPEDIDIAFYLVHAMSYGRKSFAVLEEKAINNFLARLQNTRVKQIIYLSGLVTDKNLSPHLASRYKTECIIKNSGLPYTILRAGIIIGSGSASFEMIRDLVDKLPIMVAPKWVSNLCQPIAIRDVLRYLIQVMMNPKCLNQVFDVGGPDLLSYKNMLLGYAKIKKLSRKIIVVPVLTPRLSSYWLYFVTSVNFDLASSLVDSVKNQAFCTDNRIKDLFPQPCLNYQESLEKALDVIEQNPLIPSWKDSLISGFLETNLANLANVPTYGCLIDRQEVESNKPSEEVIDHLWSIGGVNGWYYMDWAWKLRGFFDKLVGGIGLNRGRTHPYEIQAGSSLDFWRVLVADKANGHLLLYAEMKLPGEAWLEFKVIPTSSGSILKQTASFRPKGVLGRLYWYSLLPFHKMIFHGMAKAISQFN